MIVYFNKRNKPKNLDCINDSDCLKGYYCSSASKCMAVGTCSTSSDCPNLYVCNKNNLCVTTYPRNINQRTDICNSNRDCEVGEVCKNQQCIPIICNNDQNCQGSQLCYLNKCIPKHCRSNLDCYSQEACVKGKCTRILENCTSKCDCPKGLKCSKQKCVQCSDSNDCKPGETCFQGVCTNDCNRYPCDIGLTCIDGKSCAKNDGICGKLCTARSDCQYSNCNNCVNSYCNITKGKFNEKCTDNLDCKKGLVCKLGVCTYPQSNCVVNSDCKNLLPYCSNGICSASQVGMTCNSIQGCGQGLYCVNSKCRINPGSYGDKCVISSDCMNYMNCINGICIPDTNSNRSSIGNVASNDFFLSIYNKR